MVLHTIMAWDGHRAQPLFAPLHNNRYVGHLPLGVCFSLPTLESEQITLRAANNISSSKRFSIPPRLWDREGSNPPSVAQERAPGHLGAVRGPPCTIVPKLLTTSIASGVSCHNGLPEARIRGRGWRAAHSRWGNPLAKV